MITAAYLPYPPSVNTYWRHARGRTYVSAKGKQYRQDICERIGEIDESDTITEPISVKIHVHPPDNRRRDLDNVLKALLDALEAAGVYADDSQIVEIIARKEPPEPPRGHVLVEIESVE